MHQKTVEIQRPNFTWGFCLLYKPFVTKVMAFMRMHKSMQFLEILTFRLADNGEQV